MINEEVMKNLYDEYLKEDNDILSIRLFNCIVKHFSYKKCINKGWRSPGWEPVLRMVSMDELISEQMNIKGIGKKTRIELNAFLDKYINK